MTTAELRTVIKALREIQANHQVWGQDYEYNNHNNEFRHKHQLADRMEEVLPWFDAI
jgi:hypothetical protein